MTLLTNVPVYADEIELKNGDHLSGEVKKMEDALLTIKTPYAGEVSVKWKEVKRLRSDKPLKVLIHGDAAGTLRDFFIGGATSRLAATALMETPRPKP
jgi:hypothetical protein